jgi:hypothetical protein
MESKYSPGFAFVAILAAAFFAFGCGQTKPSPPPISTVRGTVRSIWLTNCSSMAVSVEPDDANGGLVTLEFHGVQPSLWKGLHAEIVYQQEEDPYHSDGTLWRWDNGRPVLQLISVTQLSTTKPK